MIKAKRFWETVSIREEGGAFTIMLDARALKTPGGLALALPARALAEVIQAEWESVDGEIRPETMPFTKMANSAAERILNQREDIENHLLEYLDNDLLSYRAEAPEELVTRQNAWDQWVEWAKGHGIALGVTTGIINIAQPKSNGEAARNWISQLNNYQLVSFYEYVVLTGSFVLAMAITEGAITAQDALLLSRIDEDFQAEQWGRTEEVEAVFQRKLNDMNQAESFFALARPAARPLARPLDG